MTMFLKKRSLLRWGLNVHEQEKAESDFDLERREGPSGKSTCFEVTPPQPYV